MTLNLYIYSYLVYTTGENVDASSQQSLQTAETTHQQPEDGCYDDSTVIFRKNVSTQSNPPAVSEQQGSPIPSQQPASPVPMRSHRCRSRVITMSEEQVHTIFSRELTFLSHSVEDIKLCFANPKNTTYAPHSQSNLL